MNKLLIGLYLLVLAATAAAWTDPSDTQDPAILGCHEGPGKGDWTMMDMRTCLHDLLLQEEAQLAQLSNQLGARESAPQKAPFFAAQAAWNRFRKAECDYLSEIHDPDMSGNSGGERRDSCEIRLIQERKSALNRLRRG